MPITCFCVRCSNVSSLAVLLWLYWCVLLLLSLSIVTLFSPKAFRGKKKYAVVVLILHLFSHGKDPSVHCHWHSFYRSYIVLTSFLYHSISSNITVLHSTSLFLVVFNHSGRVSSFIHYVLVNAILDFFSCHISECLV
jgi:hypothetical protein